MFASQLLNDILCWTFVAIGIVYLLILIIIQTSFKKYKPVTQKQKGYALSNGKNNWSKIRWYFLYFLGIIIICLGIIFNYGSLVI